MQFCIQPGNKELRGVHSTVVKGISYLQLLSVFIVAACAPGSLLNYLMDGHIK